MKRLMLALSAALLLAVCLQTANAQTTDWTKQVGEYFDRANGLLKQQQFREALDLYLRAEQLCKEHANDVSKEFLGKLYTNIGNTYGSLKDYNSVIRYYTAAYRIEKKTFDLPYKIGLCYFIVSDYENAVKWFEDALDTSYAYSISDEQKTKGYHMLAVVRKSWANRMSKSTPKYYEQLIEAYKAYQIAARGGDPEDKETLGNWFKGEKDKSGQLAGKRFSHYTAVEREAYVDEMNAYMSAFGGSGEYTLSYSEVGSHVEEENQLTFQGNGRCFSQMAYELDNKRGNKIYRTYVFDGEIGVLYFTDSSAYEYFYVMSGQLCILHSNGTYSQYKEVDSFRMK